MALAGARPHPARRRLRELIEARLRDAHAATSTPGPRDPALLDVRVAYRGSGPPAVIDLPKGAASQSGSRSACRARGAPKGAGEGFLDVFVTTSERAAGVEAAERATAEIGVANETLVEVRHSRVARRDRAVVTDAASVATTRRSRTRLALSRPAP